MADDRAGVSSNTFAQIVEVARRWNYGAVALIPRLDYRPRRVTPEIGGDDGVSVSSGLSFICSALSDPSREKGGRDEAERHQALGNGGAG